MNMQTESKKKRTNPYNTKYRICQQESIVWRLYVTLWYWRITIKPQKVFWVLAFVINSATPKGK